MVLKLQGERVSLMTVRPEDAARISHWLNDLEITVPLGGEAYTPIFPERMRREIETDGQNHSFLIVVNETIQPIGRCHLYSLDFINNSGRLGIFIGERDQWGKGYGTEAVNLLLEYAFHLLNLNSIMLGVFEFNERALHCYRKAGFREIGRLREARLVGGRYYDAVLLDLLASEFHSTRIPEILGQQNRE
ncbi:GNAT family protein [Gorillibacterium sp. CAU 1737]|uniref:GNAT family N-acetyltransferase n=1 Tax=Gorillibacterium sp. CAU 1737 TaxID=3140362 RepID=UPI0032612FAE